MEQFLNIFSESYNATYATNFDKSPKIKFLNYFSQKLL